MTLLNTHKSCEQKLEEVTHMADRWEKAVTPPDPEVTPTPCPSVQKEEVTVMPDSPPLPPTTHTHTPYASLPQSPKSGQSYAEESPSFICIQFICILKLYYVNVTMHREPNYRQIGRAHV